MKRIFGGLLAMVGLFALAHAGQNFYGDIYYMPSVYRTSVTCTNDSNVTITTRTVDFGGVIVSSAGSADSRVGIFGGDNLPVISTINASTQNPYPYGYGVYFSTPGLKYTSNGTSPGCITILWQYKFQPDLGKR